MRSGSDRQGRGGDWRHVGRACRIAFGADRQVSCVLLDLHLGVTPETLQRARHTRWRGPGPAVANEGVVIDPDPFDTPRHVGADRHGVRFDAGVAGVPGGDVFSTWHSTY